MNAEQFDDILENRLDQSKYTLGSKAKEYAVGDRLYNFKRAAEIARTTPERALLGMWLKHIVSVIDLVEGSTQLSEYLINEKIGDSINYHILLEALLREKIGAVKVVFDPDGFVAKEGVSKERLECRECSNSDTRAISASPLTTKDVARIFQVPERLVSVDNALRDSEPEKRAELVDAIQRATSKFSTTTTTVADAAAFTRGGIVGDDKKS